VTISTQYLRASVSENAYPIFIGKLYKRCIPFGICMGSFKKSCLKNEKSVFTVHYNDMKCNCKALWERVLSPLKFSEFQKEYFLSSQKSAHLKIIFSDFLVVFPLLGLLLLLLGLLNQLLLISIVSFNFLPQVPFLKILTGFCSGRSCSILVLWPCPLSRTDFYYRFLNFILFCAGI